MSDPGPTAATPLGTLKQAVLQLALCTLLLGVGYLAYSALTFVLGYFLENWKVCLAVGIPLEVGIAFLYMRYNSAAPAGVKES